MSRLDRNNTILAIIDVQEKLLPVIHDHDVIELNIERLVRGCHILGIPALVTEQYVRGLGPTTARLRAALAESGGYTPLEKMCFSGYGFVGFAEALARNGRKEVLVAGIETHVCVYQTVMDLLDAGFGVTVIADAVSSRSLHNKEIALGRMVRDGAKLSSTEMALFELTRISGTDEFRGISRLVK